MIFTDRTIIVQKGISSINDTIILYRGDKGVEIRFTLNEGSPFRFGSGASPNIIEKTEAAYGQLIIKRPNDLSAVFSEIAPTNEGKIVFTITAEMIDEITEVGNYTFQIRLLDENRNSRATLPEVVNGIEIREPIATEDVSTSNEIGVATVGYALTTAGTTEDAFDSQGNYNKTTWVAGDRITATKLNKIEAGIDGVNQKVASGSTGGETGVDLSIYQTKTDNTLNTTNKTVSGAINEINEAMVIAEEQTGDITVGEVPVGGSNKASDITIIDTAGNYTSNNVEGALQEVGSQIKEKANEIDLEVERKRIDSFTRLQEGSTTGDAELIDGRIGADGTIYNNIGDSIRSQYNQLEKGVDDLKAFKNKVVFIFNKNEGNGYLTNKGVINNDASMRCIYTDDIDCRVGDVFLYKGFAEGNAVSCLFKKDNKIISYAQYKSKNTYTEITIPSNINKVVFTSFEYTTNIENVTFDLKIKNTTLEEKINNIEIQSKETQDAFEYLNQKIDCTKNVLQDYATTGAYLYKSGNTGPDSSSTCTDYITCNKKDKFYVTGHSQYATCLVATYDENKKFLRAYGCDSEGASINHVDFEFLPKDDEKFAKFSSYQGVVVVKKLELSSVTEYVNEKTQVLFGSNILHGKKYVACGDSFTEGDFSGYVDENGLSGKNSPVIYDSDWKMYKTYPWWISRRNGMKLVNEAKCGSVFTNYRNGEGNPFSVSRYLNVPKDADYITLMFGLNETNLTDEQIGRKTDNTNATLWGAYNIVFEHFLTHMPYSKIGVIIADSWMNTKYANAVKEICAYWGIPVLDLKFDNNIPMGIGGRPGASSKAQELRDKVFKVTDSNSHPSIKAHEYRSTIIENFLRSL